MECLALLAKLIKPVPARLAFPQCRRFPLSLLLRIRFLDALRVMRWRFAFLVR